MQTASYDIIKENKSLDIAIGFADTNPIRSSSYSAFISSYITKNHDVDLTSINVTHTMLGMETNKVSYIEKDINSPGKSNLPYTPFRLPKCIRGKVSKVLLNKKPIYYGCSY